MIAATVVCMTHSSDRISTVRISVPVSAELAERTSAFATSTDRSLAAVVRIALRRLLDEGDSDERAHAKPSRELAP
jgi:hypothetical protein